MQWNISWSSFISQTDIRGIFPWIASYGAKSIFDNVSLQLQIAFLTLFQRAKCDIGFNFGLKSFNMQIRHYWTMGDSHTF